MNYPPNPDLVPRHLAESLRLYVEKGIPTGNFLAACIENNLKEAIAYADAVSMDAIPHVVSWLYKRAPSGCWGSEEKRVKWIGERTKP